MTTDNRPYPERLEAAVQDALVRASDVMFSTTRLDTAPADETVRMVRLDVVNLTAALDTLSAVLAQDPED